jgi:hypothetical protein
LHGESRTRIAVYLYLQDVQLFAERKKGRKDGIRPGAATIAKRAACSRMKVFEAVNWLQRLGVLEVSTTWTTKGRGTNRYRLVWQKVSEQNAAVVAKWSAERQANEAKRKLPGGSQSPETGTNPNILESTETDTHLVQKLDSPSLETGQRSKDKENRDKDASGGTSRAAAARLPQTPEVVPEPRSAADSSLLASSAADAAGAAGQQEEAVIAGAAAPATPATKSGVYPDQTGQQKGEDYLDDLFKPSPASPTPGQEAPSSRPADPPTAKTAKFLKALKEAEHIECGYQDSTDFSRHRTKVLTDEQVEALGIRSETAYKKPNTDPADLDLSAITEASSPDSIVEWLRVKDRTAPRYLQLAKKVGVAGLWLAEKGNVNPLANGTETSRTVNYLLKLTEADRRAMLDEHRMDRDYAIPKGTLEEVRRQVVERLAMRERLAAKRATTETVNDARGYRMPAGPSLPSPGYSGSRNTQPPKMTVADVEDLGF